MPRRRAPPLRVNHDPFVDVGVAAHKARERRSGNSCGDTASAVKQANGVFSRDRSIAPVDSYLLATQELQAITARSARMDGSGPYWDSSSWVRRIAVGIDPY